VKAPLTVTYWDEGSLRLVVPNRAIGAPRSSRARERCGGVVISVLVNAMLVVGLVRGTQLDGLPWTSTGRQNADPAPAMAVELLLPAEARIELPEQPLLTTDDPAVTWTVPPPDELAIAPPQIELTDEQAPPTPGPGAASPDEARLVSESERLRGIYAGQIEGRIERAWHRDDAWMAGVYSRRCSARVEQSAEGRVQRVEFLDCPQLPDWKRDLESAIRQASPLPAPPDQAVFAAVIYLDVAEAVHVRLAETATHEP